MPRFDALNRESESSGNQPLQRMVRIVSKGQRPQTPCLSYYEILFGFRLFLTFSPLEISGSILKSKWILNLSPKLVIEEGNVIARVMFLKREA